MRVLFVCDGGAAVGGGHVMRCLTLADALTAEGARCAFLDREVVSPILDAFAPPGTVRVKRSADWGCDWVVLDSYRTTLEDEDYWQAASRLAVIDDLGRRHACHLVIDPSFGRHPSAYAPTPALTGPKYALVRAEFAALRDAALARRQGGEVKRALIAFGLTDVGGVTEQAVRIIQPLAGGVALDVVTGAAAPSLPFLRDLADAGAITLHVNSHEMARLCAEADVAVGAGGGSTWERATVGLPSIVLALADNQVEMTAALDRKGLLVESTLDGLAGAWTRLLGDADLRTSLTGWSRAACDGRGAERVANALLSA